MVHTCLQTPSRHSAHNSISLNSRFPTHCFRCAFERRKCTLTRLKRTDPAEVSKEVSPVLVAAQESTENGSATCSKVRIVPQKQALSQKKRQTNFLSKAGAAAAGGGVVSRNITTASIRGRTAPAVTREVQTGPSTLFISNLAASVTQEDLEELFEQYHPEVVQLHFDSTGASLGTADLVVPQPQVALIQKALEGVLLDGQQIEVLETTVAKPVSVFDRIKKVSRQNDFKPKMRVTVKSEGSRVVRKGGRGGF
uniref:RRM domain-containing protein n=1 Tax=Caenorhabditis tropicalis TaxID=1561998 RepID=A0A1I7UZN6_9PELO